MHDIPLSVQALDHVQLASLVRELSDSQYIVNINGITSAQMSAQVCNGHKRRADELGLGYTPGARGRGGAGSAVTKSCAEAKADQLGLHYEKGQSGAGGAHSALTKQDLVAKHQQRLATLNALMPGWKLYAAPKGGAVFTHKVLLAKLPKCRAGYKQALKMAEAAV